MTQSTARRVIWPTDSNVRVRAVFLYVGQGSSTLVLVRNGSTYNVWLVDINLDSTCGGIDVPKLVKDLLSGNSLEAFVNTHPHDDHLKGITELEATVSINQILHSNHIPSQKYGSRYDELKKVIKKVKGKGGNRNRFGGQQVISRER